MLKTFEYRIYPTKGQARKLDTQLNDCRWLYNHFLGERKAAWENDKKSLNYHAQALSLPNLKDERPSLALVHSQVLQNVAVRIDLAMKAFFRRVKAGETPGYPRFKSYGRYDSMTFPQVGSGGCTVKDGKLLVSKIGHIRLVLHRPIEGTPKTATLKKSSTGKWYVTFCCEVEPKRLPKRDKAVGIDVGLKTFATLSDGQEIENPRFFRTEEKELAKVQRKLSKAQKGTPERRKRRKVVARVHERTSFKRDNFSHQNSRKIVDGYGVIAIEDLQVSRMLHNHCLAKSISDAAWSGFFWMMNYKAAEAGRIFIKVNPSYTSQDCSSCGHRQKMPLSERVFDCPCCRVQLGRDLNASVNILRIGLDSLRNQSVEAAPL